MEIEDLARQIEKQGLAEISVGIDLRAGTITRQQAIARLKKATDQSCRFMAQIKAAP